MKNLALIPARSGSTGLPGKNLLKIDGVSLVGRAIEAARDSQCFVDSGLTVVSSDSKECLSEAAQRGAMGLARPASLAGGEVEIVDVIGQVLALLSSKGYAFDTVCLLNPTSPFRDAKDIQECYKLHKKWEPQTTLTTVAVKPVIMTHHRRGVRRLFHVSERGSQNRQRRAPTYIQTGAVYVVDIRYFSDTHRLVGDRVACYEVPKWKAIDIDDQWDYLAALSWVDEIKAMKGLAPLEVYNGGTVEGAAEGAEGETGVGQSGTASGLPGEVRTGNGL